jgi:probable HAF family extracellular repeat protein
VKAILGVLLFLSSLRAGVIYDITDLGVLPGGTTTSAAAISSNGNVAGSGDSASAISQAFLWTAAAGLQGIGSSLFAFGTGVNAAGLVVGYQWADDFSTYNAFLGNATGTAPIPTLGGANNAATGVNNAGTVVGYSDTLNGGTQAFSYSAGVLTALEGPDDSRANAINSGGAIAGQGDINELTHPILWSGGTWTDLGVPSGFQSGYATAIADGGYVAGTLNDGIGGTMAFVWQSGGMSEVGSLTSGGDSQAYGVNSSGWVVGTSDGTAFLYDGAAMYDLNALLAPTTSAWQLTEADAINNLGQIVGVGDIDGDQHAFLLNPVSSTPEPASFALVCAAMTLIAAKRRLRTKGKSR